jgi:DeoR family fructose operon transcriptional repressor
MLTEERYRLILEALRERGTVSLGELVQKLDSSESTVRRDLGALADMGKLVKVRGGATVADAEYTFEEHSVDTKEKLSAPEKTEIARYAAATLRKGDFVFIDAGTTTEKMIDFISERDITIVTNSFTHARKLAARGFRVMITGGQIKTSTEAVVGVESVAMLERYNFTKCYLGTNGISLARGFTTPDVDEASVKSTAFRQSYVAYVLADHSKFDKISSVTFAPAAKACIITDMLPNEKYREKCVIKEVMR